MTTARGRRKTEGQQGIRRLQARLWFERAVFLSLLVFLLLLYLRAIRTGGSVSLITVDGEPVAVLETRKQAETLLEEMKSVPTPVPGEVRFAQDVRIDDVSAAGRSVQSKSEAEKALESKVEVVMHAAAVLADGELILALPDQAEAVRMLSLLLTKLAPPGPNTTVFFKEKVKVEKRDVPLQRLVASAEEGAEIIAAKAAPALEYEIKPGESAWGIARDHSITLRRLELANPDLDLNKLLAGEKLKIPGSGPALTVIARKDIEEEVAQGALRRLRKVRITYENGVEVKRDVVGGHRPVAALPQRHSNPWRWRDEIPR